MLSAVARVKGPNLPANMVQARISFPTLEREVVMPVVRPTVPKAEVTSNSSGRKPAFSVRVRINVTAVIKIRAAKMTQKAFIESIMGSVRLKTTKLSLPVINPQREVTAIPKVVVLIPPPVEPGDAPMNIRMITKKRVACLS